MIMPLIYNDDHFRWVDDDEPYDSSEYSEVRKLYVKLAPEKTVSNEPVILEKKINFASCS